MSANRATTSTLPVLTRKWLLRVYLKTTSTKLKSGPQTIPKKCLHADIGSSQPPVLPSKTIATTTKTPAAHQETCKIRVPCSCVRRTSPNIVALKNCSLTEPTLTGRSASCSAPTLLWITELWAAQMVFLTAKTASVPSALPATNPWDLARLTMKMFAVTLVRRTASGSKVSTLVCIVT